MDRRIREKESMRRERFQREKLLSKIYENWTIDFCHSRRQSWSMWRELRVGTKILAFRQTPRNMEFSYLGYFYPKGHLMAWDLLRGRERP